VFGMGTGGTLSLQSPKRLIETVSHNAETRRAKGIAVNAFVFIRMHSWLNIDGLPLGCKPRSHANRFYSILTVKFYGQAERAISNGQLNASLRLHIRPIDVVVYHGPS
jgi:hypothetical protein